MSHTLMMDKMPDMSLAITHVDNGFLVSYVKIPKPPPPPVINPEDIPNPDDIMDKMVDGIGALMRRIHDDAAGESWKDSEDRVKVRAGLRAMFPNLESQLSRVYSPPPSPEQHQLVFASRQSLQEFLEKVLPQ